MGGGGGGKVAAETRWRRSLDTHTPHTHTQKKGFSHASAFVLPWNNDLHKYNTQLIRAPAILCLFGGFFLGPP